MPPRRSRRIPWLVLATATTVCTPFKDDPSDGGLAEAPYDSGDAGPPCDTTLPFGKATLVPGLDATGAVSIDGVRLSPDSLVSYFDASGLPGGIGYHDLYTATRDTPSSPFENVTPLDGHAINTPGEDLDPTVSGDGLTLLWSNGMAGGDPVHIRYATRAVDSVPFADHGLASTVNDLGHLLDTNPFLREDGRVLYFASNRVTEDSTDIYRAPWSDSSGDAGGDPPAPVTELNTSFSEVAPVVTPDDLTIYFGSDRTDGNAQGDYDVWMATRTSVSEPFSAPVDVTELDSPSYDVPTFVTRDGCTLYFSSTRDGALMAYVATRGSR
jgi:Tol biopolymer transport system component